MPRWGEFVWVGALLLGVSLLWDALSWWQTLLLALVSGLDAEAVRWHHNRGLAPTPDDAPAIRQPSAPAGWYARPTQVGQEMWWDGQAWTGASRPAHDPYLVDPS